MKSQGIVESLAAENGNTVSRYRARDALREKFSKARLAGDEFVGQRSDDAGAAQVRKNQAECTIVGGALRRNSAKHFARVDPGEERAPGCALFRPDPAGRQYNRKRRR